MGISPGLQDDCKAIAFNRLRVLSGKLHFHNSCAVLKPIHRHLVSYFTTNPHLVQGLFPEDFHRHSRYAVVAGQLSQTEENHFVDVYGRNPTSLDGLEQQILGTFAPPCCLQHFAERC
jgi:hypothetical protein